MHYCCRETKLRILYVTPSHFCLQSAKLYISYFFYNCIYILFKFELNRSAMHPKIDPTGVQTDDFQIMDSISHDPETLALTTEQSGAHLSYSSLSFLLQQHGKKVRAKRI